MENTGITWYSNGYDVWLENINPNKLKTALRSGLKKNVTNCSKRSQRKSQKCNAKL